MKKKWLWIIIVFVLFIILTGSLIILSLNKEKSTVETPNEEESTIISPNVVLKKGSIKDVVLSNNPYLETNGNGCGISNDDNYSYMGGCYFKGYPVNNFLWYSGFLWRIMGINADGSIRLITDETVTSIPWGATGTAKNYEDSYVKDWLNNYFYNKLRGNEIIVDQTWCIKTTLFDSSTREECIDSLTKEPSKVGLITLDEFNLALGDPVSYLYIRQNQWTLTPYNSSRAWSVGWGYGFSNVDVFGGIRPIINVRAEAQITGGDGSISSNWSNEKGPYILNEDKSTDITGRLSEKVTSGEYVLYAGKKYRVVDQDDAGVKLILDGTAEIDENSVNTMTYGNDNTFTTRSGVIQKLNGEILEWLVPSENSTDRAKLVTDYIWKQNFFDEGYSYRIAIEDGEPTIATQIATQSIVGLIRTGEMLSGQSSSVITNGYKEVGGKNYASGYWSMTAHPNNRDIWFINYDGTVEREISTSYRSFRPVIVIKNDIEIIKGNGTWSSPYEI